MKKIFSGTLASVVAVAAVALGFFLVGPAFDVPAVAQGGGGYPSRPRFAQVGIGGSASPTQTVGLIFTPTPAQLSAGKTYLGFSDGTGSTYLCQNWAAAGCAGPDSLYDFDFITAHVVRINGAAIETAAATPYATCPTGSACSVASTSALRVSAGQIATNSGGCTIAGSIANLSSCVRNATGQYTVSFTTAYTSGVACMVSNPDSTPLFIAQWNGTSFSATSVEVWSSAGTLEDGFAVNIYCTGT